MEEGYDSIRNLTLHIHIHWLPYIIYTAHDNKLVAELGWEKKYMKPLGPDVRLAQASKPVRRYLTSWRVNMLAT